MSRLIGLAGIARSGKDTAAAYLQEMPKVASFALADPLKLGCQIIFGLSNEETWCDSLKETPIQHWRKSPRQLFQMVGTEWMRTFNPDFWLMRAHRVILKHDYQPLELVVDPKDVVSEFKLACHVFFQFSKDQLSKADLFNYPDPIWNIAPSQAIDLLKNLTESSLTNWRSIRSNLPTITPQIPAYPSDADTLIIKDIRFENEAKFIRDHGGEIWHIKRSNAVPVHSHVSERGIDIRPNDKVIVNDDTLQQFKERIYLAWRGEQFNP
ncbi:deoxynucleotide monophosphate kinase [Pseudomonas sp. WSY_20]|uniref:deoxynucleotide monophosphate kinase family protein n=1 Tax=Pseudomonas sp. WSY_20 TaxID=3367212 RepID=UPI00370C43D1